MKAKPGRLLRNWTRATKMSVFWFLVIALVRVSFVLPSVSAAAESESREPKADKDKAADLVQSYRNGLVVVEGKTSFASGFIADFNGRKYLVTNAHVLAGTKDARFKLLDNKSLKLGAAMLAVGHDVLMVAVLDGGTGIPTTESVATEARFGDAVVVPGNAGGTGVVNPLQGEIAGIGPERVEVSAPFEPGSSGSPIIHVKSGKVIGVATYLRIKARGSGGDHGISKLGDVRRFGYRLDSVKKWEAVDWGRFYAQANAVEKFEQTTRELELALEDFASTTAKEQGRHIYESRAISGALDAYRVALKQDPRGTVGAVSRLAASLRNVSQSDMTTKTTLAYDYFKREFETSELKRKEILGVFDKVVENLK